MEKLPCIIPYKFENKDILIDIFTPNSKSSSLKALVPKEREYLERVLRIYTNEPQKNPLNYAIRPEKIFDYTTPINYTLKEIWTPPVNAIPNINHIPKDTNWINGYAFDIFQKEYSIIDNNTDPIKFGHHFQTDGGCELTPLFRFIPKQSRSRLIIMRASNEYTPKNIYIGMNCPLTQCSGKIEFIESEKPIMYQKTNESNQVLVSGTITIGCIDCGYIKEELVTNPDIIFQTEKDQREDSTSEEATESLMNFQLMPIEEQETWVKKVREKQISISPTTKKPLPLLRFFSASFFSLKNIKNIVKKDFEDIKYFMDTGSSYKQNPIELIYLLSILDSNILRLFPRKINNLQLKEEAKMIENYFFREEWFKDYLKWSFNCLTLKSKNKELREIYFKYLMKNDIMFSSLYFSSNNNEKQYQNIRDISSSKYTLELLKKINDNSIHLESIELPKLETLAKETFEEQNEIFKKYKTEKYAEIDDINIESKPTEEINCVEFMKFSGYKYHRSVLVGFYLINEASKSNWKLSNQRLFEFHKKAMKDERINWKPSDIVSTISFIQRFSMFYHTPKIEFLDDIND